MRVCMRVCVQEPTTGMDPLSRRRVWALIRKLKEDRIVVLTTHRWMHLSCCVQLFGADACSLCAVLPRSMEEADSLGDNIAILANGRLRAVGTPLFLKNRFGAGYCLNVITSPERLPELRTLVKENLPGAEIVHGGATRLRDAFAVFAGDDR